MKAMISLKKSIKKVVINKAMVMLLGAVLLLPAAAWCQDEEENDADLQQVEIPVSTNAGPWENSAGATIGTRDINATDPTPNTPDPNLGPGGGTLSRPAAPLAGGPGGNPDVPFDENMNLAFLVAGLLFAFVVARKKWKLKGATVENK